MTDPRPMAILLAALTGALSGPTIAADPQLEGRLSRLERILENQSGSDLMLRMQQLQQEMQELRGLVETQQFELQKLQRQQRDQFLDIDARMGGAQPGESGDPLSAMPQEPAGLDAAGTALQPPPGQGVPPPITAPAPASPGSVGIPSLPSPETTGGNERDAYRDAFELLKQRKYPQAVDAFNDLLRRYPQGQYADNARYWLAETYYVQRNYPAALAEFDRLVQLNAASPRVPGALLKIGYIQYEQEDYDQARAVLRQLVNQYPQSTEARLAQSRLEKMDRERR
ncbi:MAG: tol-pal system protein YbgF [Bdellovibrio bacteriovorus]